METPAPESAALTVKWGNVMRNLKQWIDDELDDEETDIVFTSVVLLVVFACGFGLGVCMS
jgi:hypothetical protein